MKAKLFLASMLLCFVGCSLIWTPTATIKKFISSAEEGNVNAMTSLVSNNVVQRSGIEKVRTINQNFSDMVRTAIAGGAKPKMTQLEERITGSYAYVSFVYRDDEKNSSLNMRFELLKEKGAWKVNTLEYNDGTSSSPTPSEQSISPAQSPPKTAPPLSATSSPSSPVTSARTIDGGILNGKALSLPQPPYPSIARTAKASGTVVVQVLVDENGNVVSAHALSGHPLLQAASVAAARTAKFSPTKLAGQPVKVEGTITYRFEPLP